MPTTKTRPNERTVLLACCDCDDISDNGRDCDNDHTHDKHHDHDHDHDHHALTYTKRSGIKGCKSCDSFSQMKEVLHNDPKSHKDINTLLGSTSTSVLGNSIVERMAVAEHITNKNASRTKKKFVVEGKNEYDDEDTTNTCTTRTNTFPTFSGIYSEYYHDKYSLRSLRNSESNTTLRSLVADHHINSNDTDTDTATVVTRMSILFHQQFQEPTNMYLKKIKTNFLKDTKSLAEGTIPQSIVLAIIIGIVCGVACYLYYLVLFFGLHFFWETIPHTYIIPSDYWSSDYYWLWIPLVTITMATFVGLTVVYMGEPGDLPYVISRVHSDAYIPMHHVSPMVFASMFSIVAGGSLGPEAPLVVICGALGGFVSRRIFGQNSTNVVRKHTFMGMAGALSAFFGVPLGGSLFALEVCSRFGVEYFEHLMESIFCGEICLMVFRSLTGLPIQPIWDLTANTIHSTMMVCEPVHVLWGAFLGLYGALLAYMFALFHWKNMEIFSSCNLLDNKRAIYRGWIGGIFIVLLSLLVPQTAFWGEEEIQVVATMGPANNLPNIWPTEGLIGFEMDTPFKVFIVGCAKLIAVSFTVASGLRGGYIFPLLCAGSAFGRFLSFFVPATIPIQVVILCTAAAMNVAITRTALATTLILAFLPGEPIAIPPILMASLCSLFATSYMPFIKSQITRSDIDHSLFHKNHQIDVKSVFSDETLDNNEEDDDEDDDNMKRDLN